MKRLMRSVCRVWASMPASWNAVSVRQVRARAARTLGSRVARNEIGPRRGSTGRFGMVPVRFVVGPLKRHHEVEHQALLIVQAAVVEGKLAGCRGIEAPLAVIEVIQERNARVHVRREVITRAK